MVNAPRRLTPPAEHRSATAVVGPAESAPPTATSDEQRARQWRHAALAFGASSLGALVVASSYLLARRGVAGSTAVLWVGQVLIFAPPAVFAVGARRLTGRAAALVAAAVGVVPYIVKIAYSPTRLTFHDELQHRVGLVMALQRHDLGGTNPALPLASHFPGTAALGSSLAALTGLPVDTSAMIITGVAKVALTLTVLLVISELSHSYRIGLFGVLVYAANGNFEIFSSFYVYQTFALPFALLAVYCAVLLRRLDDHRVAVLVLGVLSIALTVLTHHIVAIFMTALLVVAGAWTVLRRRPRPGTAVVLGGVSLAFTLCWFVFVAHGVFAYIKPYYELTDPVVNVEVPLPTFGALPQHPPAADQLVNRLGLVLVVLACVWGIVLMLRRRATTDWSRSWRLTMTLVTVALIGSAVVAATRPFGGQAATRALVFTFLGAAVFGAVAFGWLAALERRRRLTGAVGVVAIVLCVVGGIEFGWPPWWEKLPGRYEPFGYESGVDPQVLGAARWVQQNLPAHSRITGDANAMTAVSTLTQATTAREGAPIYYDRTITADDRLVIASNRIRYVWVDTRVARTRSPSSRYFSGPLGVQYTIPPPLAGMTKWASVPKVNRVYSSGTITIYDLAGTRLDG